MPDLNRPAHQVVRVGDVAAGTALLEALSLEISGAQRIFGRG